MYCSRLFYIHVAASTGRGWGEEEQVEEILMSGGAVFRTKLEVGSGGALNNLRGGGVHRCYE